MTLMKLRRSPTEVQLAEVIQARLNPVTTCTAQMQFGLLDAVYSVANFENKLIESNDIQFTSSKTLHWDFVSSKE